MLLKTYIDKYIKPQKSEGWGFYNPKHIVDLDELTLIDKKGNSIGNTNDAHIDGISLITIGGLIAPIYDNNPFQMFFMPQQRYEANIYFGEDYSDIKIMILLKNIKSIDVKFENGVIISDKMTNINEIINILNSKLIR
jgi:hypothetical protein